MSGHGTYQTILWSLLAVTVASDVAQRRIPNQVVVPIAAFGLAAQWWVAGPGAALGGFLCGAAVLVALLLPWATGKLGGGDVKLLAATAVWMEPALILPFLALTAIAGAPVAVATRLVHALEMRLGSGAPWQRTAGGPPAAPMQTVPLAAAVALGAFAAIQWRWPW